MIEAQSLSQAFRNRPCRLGYFAECSQWLSGIAVCLAGKAPGKNVGTQGGTVFIERLNATLTRCCHAAPRLRVQLLCGV